MSTFPITVDTQSLRRELDQLGGLADKAKARAINRTLGTLRTMATRTLAGATGIKSSVVRRNLRINRATERRPEGELVSVGLRRRLVEFTVSQRASDVAYRYKGFRSLPAVSPAFVARMRTGHRGLFVRATRPPQRRGPGRSWLPIAELYGPALPDVFVRTFIRQAEVQAPPLLDKNLAHEISVIQRRIA